MIIGDSSRLFLFVIIYLCEKFDDEYFRSVYFNMVVYYGNVIEVIIYDECKFMYLWKILNDENIDVMYV